MAISREDLDALKIERAELSQQAREIRKRSEELDEIIHEKEVMVAADAYRAVHTVAMKWNGDHSMFLMIFPETQEEIDDYRAKDGYGVNIPAPSKMRALIAHRECSNAKLVRDVCEELETNGLDLEVDEQEVDQANQPGLC